MSLDTVSLNLFIAGMVFLLSAAVLPLLFLRNGKRMLRYSSLISAFISCLLVVCASLPVVVYNLKIRFVIYTITYFFSITCMIDRLSAFFIILIAVVSLSVIIYSFSYIEHMIENIKKNMIVCLICFFIVSMIMVVISLNMFAFLFFWEIMSITSFFLVMSEYEKAETKKAGLFYFIMTQLSTLFLIFGFMAIANISGSYNFENLDGVSSIAVNFIFVSLFIGFGIKAGIVPFHKWLPYAHPASPSNVSALMSGVMIKVAVYGIVRYVVDIAQPPLWGGIFILIMGTISALLGVIYALKEHDIKRLLAYHSIENIGIILLGVGLFVIFTNYNLTALATLSILGALFHTINHAIFKSLLFMAAGSVVQATGTRNIEEMGGLVKRMPFTSSLFLVGAVSISALPPFNGFVSELMIFLGFFQSGALLSPILEILMFTCLSLFALTSSLAAACFVKAFGITFLAMPRSDHSKNAVEVKMPMLIGPAIPAVLCVVLGVFSSRIFTFLGFDLPIPDLLVISSIAIISAIAVIIIVKISGRTKYPVRIDETWGCGILSQNPKMEYTASGFSEPIMDIFKPVYRTHTHIEKEYSDKHNTLFQKGFAEIRLFEIFEEYLYMPIARFVMKISADLAKIQNVIEPDSYILYTFVTFLLLLIIGGWFI